MIVRPLIEQPPLRSPFRALEYKDLDELVEKAQPIVALARAGSILILRPSVRRPRFPRMRWALAWFFGLFHRGARDHVPRLLGPICKQLSDCGHKEDPAYWHPDPPPPIYILR